MAENLKEIRRRIRSVEATQKITSAMKMVAAAKLRRAQTRAEAGRPYSDAIRDVLRTLASQSGHASSPLLERREVRRVGYVVITGDRGLSGPYNSSVIRALHADEGQGGVAAPQLVIVGRKGVDHFRRRSYDIRTTFVNIGDTPGYALASEIGKVAVDAFVEAEVDEVRLVYTRFVTAMTQRPVVDTLLPISPPEALEEETTGSAYLFEPDEESVLDLLLPTYVGSLVYAALLESKASEQGARMTAMDSATRNAGDLIRSLVLLRNRARQAAITKEIAEIVGGAAALE